MAQFFTNEAVSLEKSIDTTIAPIETDPQDIDKVYELEKCIEWIVEGQYKKVCLQFPDYLLPDSCEIASRLQKRLGQVVYIMGDSAYESCCVDYITAQHADADSIIHFGPRCLSTWTDIIPCLCIYDKFPVDIDLFSSLFSQKFTNDSEEIGIILNTPYLHKKTEFEEKYKENLNVKVYSIEQDEFKSDTVVYVGQNNRKLLNFHLKYKPKVLYYYDPRENDPLIKNYEENSVILKRRRFLIEKIKDSKTIGIIIGTVVIENFLKAIERIKKLCKLHQKKYYIISVGRPTVAKLANFPEMDIYVLICCSMSDVFDSREFYKPIVTAFDVEMALNPKASDLSFSYEVNSEFLNEIIDESFVKGPDVSLLTGNLRYNEDNAAEIESTKQLALKDKGTMAISDKSGAGFLAKRTFKGLEQNLGQTEVKLAEEGKRGVAGQYDNECF